MRYLTVLGDLFLIAGVLVGTSNVSAQDPQEKEASASESKGLPPRATPGDYQAQAKVGALTIGAEFMSHSVPTPDAIYNTEDYVVVEVGLFGSSQAPLRVAVGDFSLRINGKKAALANQPVELALKSLKDPTWEPPKSEEKSKTSIGNGGNAGDPPPATPKMPFELRRPMEQRVQRASMIVGDRPLPQAGLLFFEYHGKAQSIRSVELIYSGSAGNAALELHP